MVVFWTFAAFVSINSKLNKHSGGILAFLVLFLSHMVVVNVVGEKFNNYLIDQDYKETNAIIKDCAYFKGTEHCLYSYKVGNKYYKHKY